MSNFFAIKLNNFAAKLRNFYKVKNCKIFPKLRFSPKKLKDFCLKTQAFGTLEHIRVPVCVKKKPEVRIETKFK